MTVMLEPSPAVPCTPAPLAPSTPPAPGALLVAVTDEPDLDVRLAPAIAQARETGLPLYVVVAQSRPGWTVDFGMGAIASDRAAQRLRVLTAQVRARADAAGVAAVVEPVLVRGSVQRAVEREFAHVAALSCLSR